MSEEKQPSRPLLDRRTLLRSGAAAALAAPLGVIGAQALPFRAATPAIDFSEFPICRTASDTPPIAGVPRKLKLSWNAGAVCLAPVPIAIEYGFFQKHNLDVELINFGGSTEALLEALATGKADAGVGMALRWLKALEQGSTSRSPPVRMAAACALLRPPRTASTARRPQGQDDGHNDLNSPGKNFFSILFPKEGIDPVKDVEWRRIRARCWSPSRRARRRRSPTATRTPTSACRTAGRNRYQSGRLTTSACCIVGLRGSLLRDDPQTARA